MTGDKLRRQEKFMSEPNPAVSLENDTAELANSYEEASVIQFDHGKILIDALRIRPGENVLDIGCGTGRLAEFVAKIVGPAGTIVGIDPLGVPDRYRAVTDIECSKIFSGTSGRFIGVLRRSIRRRLPEQRIPLDRR